MPCNRSPIGQRETPVGPKSAKRAHSEMAPGDTEEPCSSSFSVDELMDKMNVLLDSKLEKVATKDDINGLAKRLDNLHTDVEKLKEENASLKSELETEKRC